MTVKFLSRVSWTTAFPWGVYLVGKKTCWVAALVGPDLIYNEHPAFSLLTPPFPAVYISSLPLSPVPLSLFTNMSHPLPLCAFGTLYLFPFHSSSTSSYHTCRLCSAHSAGINRRTTPLPPNHWKHSVSPASHPWSSLPLHTHTSCVCVSPFTLPSSTSPLTSPPSLQLSSSLPELTLSLAFALTGQSPRAERPHLLFDLSPSLLSLASSLQPLTHSSAAQPSG